MVYSGLSLLSRDWSGRLRLDCGAIRKVYEAPVTLVKHDNLF